MLGKRVGPVLLASAAQSVDVSPVEKVITLLEDLIAQTEDEGKAEATTYDEFACFCKDTTLEKSSSVTDGQDNIESLSASIAEKTATKNDKIEEIATRKKRQEELAKKLEETKVRLQKEKSEYETIANDLSKAINSMQSAIAALEDSKPGFLLQVRDQVRKSLQLGQLLNASQQRKAQKLTALLQSRVDPSDPEYQFHSQGIIDVINDLLTDLNGKKAEEDAEWEKTETTETNLISDTEGQMEENADSIGTLEGDVDDLSTQIAGHREDLVDAENLLKDDELYLKDLTERCEQRANAYDQRSSMRAKELEALNTATNTLKNKVKSADEGANERALLQKTVKAGPVASFLQTGSSRTQLSNLLQKARGQTLSAQVRTEKVLGLLASEGQRLNSIMLNSLVVKIKEDPFKKVKELIQKLIERLVEEATAEATKKGFCDTELGKAEKSRNHRWQDVMRLNAELSVLEARRDELDEEIGELSQSLKELNSALEEATKLRSESKAENLATLKEAKEGLNAVKEAQLVLKVFYKNAAKAKVFLQASPVDEDDPGAESGAYKGNQTASKAILGLLEVILSDFERTIKNTSAQEDQETAEFVEFDRTSKADIAGKTTKSELNSQDLETTKIKIDKAEKDMQSNMELVDTSLEELEELKPVCIDTGMSYEERVQKREEEIDALKRALCMLDTDGVEPECQS